MESRFVVVKEISSHAAQFPTDVTRISGVPSFPTNPSVFLLHRKEGREREQQKKKKCQPEYFEDVVHPKSILNLLLLLSVVDFRFWKEHLAIGAEVSPDYLTCPSLSVPRETKVKAVLN